MVSAVCAAMMLAGEAGCSSSSVSVSSPDGHLKLTLCQADGGPAIAIAYKGEDLILPSPIGFEFSDGSFKSDIKVSKGRQTRVVEAYDLVTGKTSHVESESNQRVVTLTSRDGMVVELYMRAFDDGVAYRYVFPAQSAAQSVAQPAATPLLIKSEIMDLRPNGDPIVKAMFIPWGWNSHEDVYLTDRLSNMHETENSAESPVLLSFDS